MSLHSGDWRVGAVPPFSAHPLLAVLKRRYLRVSIGAGVHRDLTWDPTGFTS